MADWTPSDDRHLVVVRGKLALGAAVRSSRLAARAPQRRLAELAGISQPIISRLETGRLNGIRWQTLAAIIGVLESSRPFELPGQREASRRLPGQPPD